MKFRMKDLSNFMEVATCRTMSEASKKLGITQPALSESIKRLESDLRGILLYRARTGITLTPAGGAVLVSAKSAMSFLSEIESIQELRTRFGSRMIAVGAHPTVAAYCLPGALQKLEVVAPDYKIKFKHGLSRHIQSDIQQGLIDIGIVVNPSPSPDLIIRKIADDKVTVWTKKDHANKVFCNLDLIQTQALLRKWKNQPEIKAHTDSLELIVHLTQAGLGYGILPARIVRLYDTPIRQVKLAPEYHDLICVVYRPEFGKSQIEREVIKALSGSFDI